jgi:hypothetical protein
LPPEIGETLKTVERANEYLEQAGNVDFNSILEELKFVPTSNGLVLSTAFVKTSTDNFKAVLKKRAAEIADGIISAQA